MKVIVTTQMRSGTHWTLDIIEALTGVKWDFIRFGWRLKPTKIGGLCNMSGNRVWCMHNADPRTIVPNLSKGTFCITTVRNPWDQFVSLGMYIRNNPFMHKRKDLYPLYYIRDEFGHKNLNDIEWLNKLAFSPLMEFYYINWKMYHSFEDKRCLKVSFEDLTKSPLPTIKTIADFLRLPKRKNYHDINRLTSFHRKTGRQKGDNQGKWKFRNFGEEGRYKMYLKQETVDYIEKKVHF